MKNWYKNHTCEELVPNPHTCEILVPNYHRCEKMALNRHRCEGKNCEELESNAKCSIFGGYFINMRNTHVCYMKFDFVRMFHKV